MRKNRVRIDTPADTALLVLIYCLLAFGLLLVLYPLLWTVSASFSDPFEIRAGKLWFLPVGFQTKGYHLVFSNDELMTGYINSLFYLVAGTAINIVMTICAAFPLSCKELAIRKPVTALITFTMWFNGGIIPNYLLFRSLSLTNTVWSVLISGAISAYNMIIMRNYFESSIPEEIREAAKIDGCTNVSYLWRIAIRLSGPIIAVMLVFYGVFRWNDYFNALIYITNRKLYPLQLFLREILIINQMSSMQEATDSTMNEMLLATESVKYAAVLVSSIPVLIIYPFVQRYMLKGIMIGAVKG